MSEAPQWREALDNANRVRIERGKLCKRIAKMPPKQARLKIARMLERNGFDSIYAGMSLEKLLKSAHRYGSQKAVDICEDAGMARGPKVTLEELTLRERRALGAELRRRAAIL